MKSFPENIVNTIYVYGIFFSGDQVSIISNILQFLFCLIIINILNIFLINYIFKYILEKYNWKNRWVNFFQLQ